MADSVEAHAPILAAGGIVLREGTRPRIAIVRLRCGKVWVLPKGKLHPGERAQVAARREVLEARAAGNPFTKAIGGWFGRIMAQPSIRRIG